KATAAVALSRAGGGSGGVQGGDRALQGGWGKRRLPGRAGEAVAVTAPSRSGGGSGGGGGGALQGGRGKRQRRRSPLGQVGKAAGATAAVADAVAVFFPLVGKLTYVPSTGDVVVDCSPSAVGDGATATRGRCQPPRGTMSRRSCGSCPAWRPPSSPRHCSPCR
ncbi:Os01g0738900, partial [Oryza sativa Japonica Group]